MSRVVRTVVVLVVGLGLAALVAAAAAMSARDAMDLIGIAAGVVLLTALVALPLLRSLRRRSVGVQVSALALVVAGAISLGVAAAAQAMFISEHDLAAIDVVLLAATTVAVAVALTLGDRIAKTSEALVAVTRRVGTGEPIPADAVAGPPELEHLARELELMQHRLDEASARERAVEDSRRQLVAWVSHDLRTPLAALRAMVEAIDDGVVSDSETIARYHATMKEETDRLTALVDDLFELSRAEAGAVRLQWERVSLGDLVSDAIAGVQPVAEAKGVRLTGRLDGAAPEVQVSPPEVLRALRNVLENAIRHTPTDGSVMVELGSLPPDRVFVSVLDSGGGVPEADLDRIFDAAYQADPASAGGGAGLGLAIARGFVEAHAGEIVVRNEPGGARFTVHLPQERVG